MFHKPNSIRPKVTPKPNTTTEHSPTLTLNLNPSDTQLNIELELEENQKNQRQNQKQNQLNLQNQRQNQQNSRQNQQFDHPHLTISLHSPHPQLIHSPSSPQPSLQSPNSNQEHFSTLSPKQQLNTQLVPTPTTDDHFNNRPLSRLSLSSTPNIFKRIRAGMSMRGGSSSSLISHLERITPAPPSRSTSSLYSNLTDPHELKSPKQPQIQIYNNNNNSNQNTPTLNNSIDTSPESSKNKTLLPRQSTSNLENLELGNEPSMYATPTQGSSDSSSQHQSTMEELRTKPSTENQQRPGTVSILRSYSDASIGALGIYSSSNSNQSIQMSNRPNSSCHYNREPFTDQHTPTQKMNRPQSPNKLRRPRTSASTIPKLTPTPTTTQPTPAKSVAKSKVLERLNDEETEQDYLIRLGEKVPRSKIPSLLASSNQPFHLSALTKFMGTFEFSHDPIDLSIRKFLMTVDLPPETQQIDRVIESFAKRYTECNPKLFKDPDQVYILAFSIIMLHTDAFNKSNKAKMSRADYVKNTKLDGITTELLEYIYDNVTYTPFVYVESNNQDTSRTNFLGSNQYSNDNTGLFSLAGSNTMSSMPASPRMSPGPNNFKVRLDPYQWISQGWTHELRPDLGSVIPSRNPFSFTGSVSWFDFKRLKDSFSPKKSVMIQIVNQNPYKPNSIFKQIESEDFLLESCNLQQQHFISSTSNFRRQRDDDPTTATNDSTEYHNQPSRPSSRLHHTPAPLSSSDVFLNLRAIKVGLIHLKIDLPFLLSSSTQSNNSQSQSHTQSHIINESNLNRNVVTKKWKLFCVLLSAGQLILIKDFGLIGELQESIKLAGIKNQSNPDDQLVVRITGLKPDAVLSLDGAIALMDSTYKRRPCTFRLILSKNLSVLMALNDNDEMDSWITHINYAAAHKTHRIPFRLFDHQSAVSRPVSIVHSSNENRVNTPTIPRGGGQNDAKRSFESLLAIPKRQSTDQPPLSRSASISNMLTRSQDRRRTSLTSTPVINSNHNASKSPTRLSTMSHASSIPTQYDIVRATILNIEAQIHASKKELNEDLRLARNLAVLTPFQLSTRSRLHQAILPIADRVKSSRCLLSKLVCYREILIRDFSTAQTGSSSSVNNHPPTTKLDSSVKPREASPTGNSLEQERKEHTITTAPSSRWVDNSNSSASVFGTPSSRQQQMGKRRQNSLGDVLDLDPSSLSKMEKSEIMNRRASLGERYQGVSSVDNNSNKYETSFAKSRAGSNRSIDSNDKLQHERRLSGSFIMSCGISAVRSRNSPLRTSLRKSREPSNEISTPHPTVDGAQIKNQDSQVASTSTDGVEPAIATTSSSNPTTTPDTNKTSIDTGNSNSSASNPKPVSRVQQNSDDDEEVIGTTTLRKVGRHRSEDYLDHFVDPVNHPYRIPDPRSYSRTRSSTATTTHTWRSTDQQQSQSITTTPARSSSKNYNNGCSTSQSLSKSFSKFPKGLLRSSKRSLNQSTTDSKNYNNPSRSFSSIANADGWKDKKIVSSNNNNNSTSKEDESLNTFEQSKQTPPKVLMIKLEDQRGQEGSGTGSSSSTPAPSTNRTRMMMKAKLAWNRNSSNEQLLDETNHDRLGCSTSTATTTRISQVPLNPSAAAPHSEPIHLSNISSRPRTISNLNNNNNLTPSLSPNIITPGQSINESSSNPSTTTNSNRFTNAWGLP